MAIHRVLSLDGGVYAGNPAMIAFAREVPLEATTAWLREYWCTG